MGVLDVGFRELAMLPPSNSPYAAMNALLLLEVGFEHMCLSRYGAWKGLKTCGVSSASVLVV